MKSSIYRKEKEKSSQNSLFFKREGEGFFPKNNISKSTAQKVQREEEDTSIDFGPLGMEDDHGEVPPFEAITATTATQNSKGELDSRAGQLWRRKKIGLYDAAFKVADNKPLSGHPHATQSPKTEGRENFEPSWVLFIGAWNYKGTKYDLPDVKKILSKRSQFQKSLAGSFDKVINVRNPKGAEIRPAISNTYVDLWAARPNGKIGELVIYFSGHGGGDGVSGIDWKSLSFADMYEAAKAAQRLGVHVTYIVDACNVGELVQFSQADALKSLEKKAQNLKNPDQVNNSLDTIRFLGSSVLQMGRKVDDLYSNIRYLNRKKYKAQYKKVLSDLLSDVEKTNDFISGDKAALTGEAIDHLEPRLSSFKRLLKKISRTDLSGYYVRKIRLKAAPIHDFINDMVNQSIRWTRDDIRKGEKKK